jgi:hypothetical protein
MATLRWYGGRVADKMAYAAALGIDRTMAEAVSNAKDNHPSWPPASEPYERFHSRTGYTVNSIQIIEPGHLDAKSVHGQWGSRSKVSLFLEIGTSTDGPTVEERVDAAGGNFGMITPAIGPLMAPRPFLRPAMDLEYPRLAARIGAAFRGQEMI